MIAELEHLDENKKYLTDIQVPALSGDKEKGYTCSVTATFLTPIEAEEGPGTGDTADTTTTGTAE